MPEISSRQYQYIARQKKRKHLITAARILIFVLFLTIWELSATHGLIDSFIFSSPSLIFRNFIRMCQDQSLFTHIGITLTETLVSFFFVVLLSIGTAVLLWCFSGLAAVLEPYLVVLNSLPKSALAPLLIVWLGANVRTIIVAGMSVAIFGSVINLYSGFCQADPEKLKLIETLGGRKKEKLTKIVLPSSVPLILSIMKVNIGLCLVGVIIGEFIGARQGLGYLIIYGSQTFKLTWVLMSIILLCIIAMVLYGILNLMEKWVKKNSPAFFPDTDEAPGSPPEASLTVLLWPASLPQLHMAAGGNNKIPVSHRIPFLLRLPPVPSLPRPLPELSFQVHGQVL